jgi:hypothetical protein
MAIDVAGPFSQSDQGNRYLLIAADYFTKWPEAYANPNQEASMVAESLVTNFFCRFQVPWELHSDQGCNLESCLIQHALQRLGVSKTQTMPLHPQSDGMVKLYIKAVEKYLRKEGHRISQKELRRTIGYSSFSWHTGHLLTTLRV